MVQLVRFCASTAGDSGSIPGQENKDSAVFAEQLKKKKSTPDHHYSDGGLYKGSDANT